MKIKLDLLKAWLYGHHEYLTNGIFPELSKTYEGKSICLLEARRSIYDYCKQYGYGYDDTVYWFYQDIDLEYTDEVAWSSGVLIVKDESLLVGHVTGKTHYDIPKGHLMSEFESLESACIRECYEETNFSISPDDLEYIGLFPHSVKKDVALFKYIGDTYPELNELKCNSLIEVDGKDIYEMDHFKYIPLSELSDNIGQSLNYTIKKIGLL